MNDRFKFRVWDKYTHETPAEYMQFLCFDGYLVDCDGCHHSPDDYIVEQCTGLKDKNGNLIYEGDIIKDELGRKYQAQWNKTQWLFTGNMVDFYPHILNILYTPTESCEIVGNIHEQKDK